MEISTFFALLSLFSGGVILFIGLFVLHLSPRDQLNQVFVALCLAVSALAFVEMQYRFAPDGATAQPWVRLGSFWPLAVVLLLQFSLVYTRRGYPLGKWPTLALLYIPAVFVGILNMATGLVIGGPVEHYWGWTFSYPSNPVAITAFTYFAAVGLLALIICMVNFIQAPRGRQKRQALLVLAGIACPVLAGMIGEGIAPLFGMRLPEFTTFAGAIGVGFFIGYAIWKYELFAITPEMTSQSIMTIMSDGIIIAGPDRNILDANRQALGLLGYSHDQLAGRPLAGLFPNDNSSRAFTENVMPSLDQERKKFGELETTLSTTGDGQIPVSYSISPIISRMGEIKGYVFAFRDISERKISERKLRDSEARFRGLMQQSPLCTIIFNPDGEIVDLNQAVTDLWRLDIEQINSPSGRYNIFEDEELESRGVMPYIKRGFAGVPTEVPAFEYEVEPADNRGDHPGLKRWVRSFLYPIRDESGQLHEIVLVHEDVTTQMEAENKLNAIIAQRNALMENLQSGILFEDNDRRIKYTNEVLTQLFGMDIQPEQLIDKDCAEAVSDSASMFVHPDGFKERITELIGSTRPVLNEELELLDGRTFQRDYIPVFVGEERLGHLWHYRDISVMKSIQRQLEDERNYLDRLQNAMGDAVFVVRMPERVIESVNEAITQILGYAPEQLIGQHTEFLNPSHDDYLAFGEIVTSGMRGRDSVIHSPLNIISKNGHVVPCEATVSFLKDGGGSITRVISILRDVSERKKAEERLNLAMEELERSNQDLEHFAYAVSHDLQEPLRMVSSYVELLSKRYSGRLGSDADDFIAYAIDGAARMKTMIDDLLTYSRVGTRGKPLNLVESETAMEIALSNLAKSVNENSAAVTHSPLPRVLADESQLVQLFQNLIGNAIKFRRKATPRIHVKAEKQDGYYQFSVTDNGLGIDSGYHERIFQVFQRLNRRDEYQGTGIGLAICKRVIERHGGQIWVESESGRGSTFYFTLPASGYEGGEETSGRDSGNINEVIRNHAH